MTSLFITRGLPGSGKTTWAENWVASNRHKRARVNRDDLRMMLHGGRFTDGPTEEVVTLVADAATEALLRRGVDVIRDDTNLRSRYVRRHQEIAREHGADLRVIDFSDVGVDTCIERDAQRLEPVGREVIRDLHMRFVHKRGYPLPMPEVTAKAAAPTLVPYTPPENRPPAVIVDIDGTVALMGDRNPYDMTRVSEDTPNHPVIAVARAMRAAGNYLVFVSGRDKSGCDDTRVWLEEHVGRPFLGPYMREVGDRRPDWIFKSEIFDEQIRTDFVVTCVLDDRDQVVELWRKLGLTVLQVAEGKF